MPLSPNINTREFDKFDLNSSNETAVRVIAEIVGAVLGSFTPSGLTVGGVTNCFDITTTASALPATPQVGRNHILIHNTHETEILYVGFSSSVTADRAVGSTAGKEIYPGEEWGTDISDDIILYGICATGPIRVKTTELA